MEHINNNYTKMIHYCTHLHFKGYTCIRRPPNTSFSLRFLGQDDEFDDDYESPYSDDDGSGGDYESPNDDQDAGNDYEPPPSEPAEDHKLCPPRPIGDGDYIGTLMSSHTPENITIESSFGSFLTPDAVIEFVSVFVTEMKITTKHAL